MVRATSGRPSGQRSARRHFAAGRRQQGGSKVAGRRVGSSSAQFERVDDASQLAGAPRRRRRGICWETGGGRCRWMEGHGGAVVQRLALRQLRVGPPRQRARLDARPDITRRQRRPLLLKRSGQHRR